MRGMRKPLKFLPVKPLPAENHKILFDGGCMVSAIGSSTTSSAAPTTGTSTAGIEAQIVRYKKELSDCVNCASSKTPEGKAAIEAISTKISTAQARIEKINTDKPPAPSTTTANNTPTNTYAAASTAASKTSVESVSASTASGSTTGRLVDVFA
jgi:hypothetical protein